MVFAGKIDEERDAFVCIDRKCKALGLKVILEKLYVWRSSESQILKRLKKGKINNVYHKNERPGGPRKLSPRVEWLLLQQICSLRKEEGNLPVKRKMEKAGLKNELGSCRTVDRYNAAWHARLTYQITVTQCDPLQTLYKIFLLFSCIIHVLNANFKHEMCSLFHSVLKSAFQKGNMCLSFEIQRLTTINHD